MPRQSAGRGWPGRLRPWPTGPRRSSTSNSRCEGRRDVRAVVLHDWVRRLAAARRGGARPARRTGARSGPSPAPVPRRFRGPAAIRSAAVRSDGVPLGLCGAAPARIRTLRPAATTRVAGVASASWACSARCSPAGRSPTRRARTATPSRGGWARSTSTAASSRCGRLHPLRRTPPTPNEPTPNETDDRHAGLQHEVVAPHPIARPTR
jgi:hypothetical protein